MRDPTSGAGAVAKSAPRAPGDADGVGCLEDVFHVWSEQGEVEMTENLTGAEFRNLPMDERIQVTLTLALGEDQAANAYDAIKPLLREAWRVAHLCGVLCEREDVRRCSGNPFAEPKRGESS